MTPETEMQNRARRSGVVARRAIRNRRDARSNDFAFDSGKICNGLP